MKMMQVTVNKIMQYMHRCGLLMSLCLVGCINIKSPSTPQEHVKYAIAAVKMKDYSEASLHINAVLRDHDDSMFLHLFNGLIYEKMAVRDEKCWQRAAIEYQKAFVLSPNNFYTAMAVGKVFLREHQYGEARALFSKALSLKPNNSEAAYGMACALYGMRDVVKAKQFIAIALKNVPNDPYVYRVAALIYTAVGEREKASHYDWRYKIVAENVTKDVPYFAASDKDVENAKIENKMLTALISQKKTIAQKMTTSKVKNRNLKI